MIAPLWHTALIVLILLTFSFLGASPQKQVNAGPYTRVVVYGGTFLFELIIVALIWFWIRRSGFSMRELIGGHWPTVESFLLDFALAVGFLLASLIVRAGVSFALGTVDFHHPEKQLEDIKRMLGHLIPRTKVEVGLFVLLSVSAGLFEEIIFRGYLQRQLGAITGKAYVGLFVAAVIFGLSHAYQGWRMMIVIAVFGAMFGLLAHLRKSLRPGMMAHAMQDAYSGVVLYFLTR